MQKYEKKISIIGVYVNNFLLVFNTMIIINIIKEFLVKKYNTQDLKEVKTIIG